MPFFVHPSFFIFNFQFLCSYVRNNQSHHPCRPQHLPLQHLQPSLLLQFEEGRVDAQTVGTAMLENVVHGDTIGIPA